MAVFIFILAHPAGFEPATPSFGGTCHIQLGHGCMLCIIIIYPLNAIQISNGTWFICS